MHTRSGEGIYIKPSQAANRLATRRIKNFRVGCSIFLDNSELYFGPDSNFVKVYCHSGECIKFRLYGWKSLSTLFLRPHFPPEWSLIRCVPETVVARSDCK